MRPRWPQRTIRVSRGWYIFIMLLILASLVDRPVVDGALGAWALWWAGTAVADWADRRGE